MILTNIWNRYAATISQIILRDRSTMRYRAINCLHLGIYLIYSIRFLIGSIVCYNKWKQSYFSVEHLIPLSKQTNKFAHYVIFALSIEVFCPLCFYYLLNIRTDVIVFQIYFDLIEIKNKFLERNSVFQLRQTSMNNYQIRINTFVTKIKQYLLNIKYYLYMIKTTFKMSGGNPSYLIKFPFVTVQISLAIQMRIWLIWIVIELVHGLLHLFSISIFLVALAFYSFKLINNISYNVNYSMDYFQAIIVKFGILFDISLGYYMAIIGIRNCLFFTYSSLIYINCFRWHLNELNFDLINWKHLLRYDNEVIAYSRLMIQFFSKHNSIVHILVHLNKRYISPGLMSFLATNMALNIYIVTMLMIRSDLATRSKFIMICFAGLQFIGPLIAIIPLLQVTKSIYASAKYMRPLMFALLPSKHVPLSYKLKIVNYYERLQSKGRMVFSVGPLSKLKTKSLFDVNAP